MKIKKPPIKLRRFFAPLIDKCTKLIVNAPPQTNSPAGDKRITVEVVWPRQDGVVLLRPKDFPQGKSDKATETSSRIKYDVVKLLKWFCERGYINYTAKELFSSRFPTMARLAQNEIKLDKMLALKEDFLYNDSYKDEG